MRLHGPTELAVGVSIGAEQRRPVEASDHTKRRRRREYPARRRTEEAQPALRRHPERAGDIDPEYRGQDQILPRHPARPVRLRHGARQKDRHRVDHRPLMDAVILGIVDLVAVDQGGTFRRQAVSVAPDTGGVTLRSSLREGADQFPDKRSPRAGEPDADAVEYERLSGENSFGRQILKPGADDVIGKTLDGILHPTRPPEASDNSG